jgi:hypothetical protein
MFKLYADHSTSQEGDWYSDCGESDNEGDDTTPSYNLYHGCELEEEVDEEGDLYGGVSVNEYQDDVEDFVCSQGNCGQGNSVQGRFRILRELEIELEDFEAEPQTTSSDFPETLDMQEDKDCSQYLD